MATEGLWHFGRIASQQRFPAYWHDWQANQPIGQGSSVWGRKAGKRLLPQVWMYDNGVIGIRPGMIGVIFGPDESDRTEDRSNAGEGAQIVLALAEARLLK